MIEDGYWKYELKKDIWKLKVWTFLSGIGHKFSEHQVNKYLLYSAIKIRKLIEDERNARNEFSKFIENGSPADANEKIPGTANSRPEFPLPDYKINALRYHFEGELEFLPHRPIPDFYKKGNEMIEINGECICNQIIHNYLWSLAYEEGGRKLIGFLVSSDNFKTKDLFLVQMKDWIQYVLYCKDHCSVNEINRKV